VVVGDVRYYVIFGSLRDDLLGWNVFKGEGELAGEFIYSVELFAYINIWLALIVEVHKLFFYQSKY
jgi:hypothetical protein